LTPIGARIWTAIAVPITVAWKRVTVTRIRISVGRRVGWISRRIGGGISWRIGSITWVARSDGNRHTLGGYRGGRKNRKGNSDGARRDN
jgi:hypothetical protein